MFIDKRLQAALLVSFITHSVILFPNPVFNTAPKIKKEVKLAIKYIRRPVVKKGIAPLASLTKREPLLPLSSKMVVVGRAVMPPPPAIDKEEMFKNAKQAIAPNAPHVNKPTMVNNDVINIKKRISLPPVDQDKINNPSYISYYQLVREKIKRAAYQNYSRVDTGDVYISFVISDDGYLKNLILNEEKSCLNNYLKEIAKRSVTDASPFPNFPKDLDYPQLSFNVIISFEIEN